MTDLSQSPPTRDRDGLSHQGRIGLTLAGAILSVWALAHVYAVFFYPWGPHSILTAPALGLLICWLYVGMFIIAHDCMHGSLVPTRPDWNRTIGKLVLFLYAGFDFDSLRSNHRLHHRHSGTDGDPDFDAHPPHGFVHWYGQFLTEYFSWRQMAVMVVIFITYLVLLGAPIPNLLAFWAAPAILSSLQLFTFGTYLPHRPGAHPFADHHRARSSRFGWWVSFLTCYHFGYHHEHHVHPSVPWWQLPRLHQASLQSPSKST